jgi:hypothetical protein
MCPSIPDRAIRYNCDEGDHLRAPGTDHFLLGRFSPVLRRARHRHHRTIPQPRPRIEVRYVFGRDLTGVAAAAHRGACTERPRSIQWPATGVERGASALRGPTVSVADPSQAHRLSAFVPGSVFQPSDMSQETYRCVRRTRSLGESPVGVRQAVKGRRHRFRYIRRVARHARCQRRSRRAITVLVHGRLPRRRASCYPASLMAKRIDAPFRAEDGCALCHWGSPALVTKTPLGHAPRIAVERVLRVSG